MALVPVEKPNEIVDVQSQRILEFLANMGLPADHIIAPLVDRQTIGSALPAFIDGLSPEIKRNARYLSKFVVGAGYGLFDYSLNAIWNEVVVTLRTKAVMYGLDIFFDAAVGASKNREMYQTEEDLSLLKDATVLDACLKLELIRDLTHAKLHHILHMRNHVGISHPNDYVIGSYELLGWLQTCINEVLADQPTENSLRVKSFVENLKRSDVHIDAAQLQTIEQHLKALPTHFCGNILRTVFGIFVSATTDQTVRKNISLIAPIVWAACKEEPKYKLGIVLEGYKANLQQEKYDFGTQFFTLVDGNAYRSESEKGIILSELILQLKERHESWDNFHHEVPVVRTLTTYLPNSASIPDSVGEILFKTVLSCRVGNGVAYQSGVSQGAKPFYDHILKLTGDRFTPHVFDALKSNELRRKLSNSRCRTQAKQALTEAKENVINERFREGYDFLIKGVEDNGDIATLAEFSQIFRK